MERNINKKAGQYKYQQIFGYKGPTERVKEEDVISTIKFDQSGLHLAVGDKVGRIIVFEGKESKKGGMVYDYFT